MLAAEQCWPLVHVDVWPAGVFFTVIVVFSQVLPDGEQVFGWHVEGGPGAALASARICGGCAIWTKAAQCF